MLRSESSIVSLGQQCGCSHQAVKKSTEALLYFSTRKDLTSNIRFAHGVKHSGVKRTDGDDVDDDDTDDAVNLPLAALSTQPSTRLMFASSWQLTADRGGCRNSTDLQL